MSKHVASFPLLALLAMGISHCLHDRLRLLDRILGSNVPQVLEKA